MSQTPFDDNKTWTECYDNYLKVRNPFYDCVMPRGATPWKLENIGFMYRRLLFDMTYDQIAEDMKDMGAPSTGAGIRYRVKKAYPDLYVSANKNYMVARKFTTADAIKAKTMWAEGKSYKDIQKEIGCCSATVSNLIHQSFMNATIVAEAQGGGGN